MHAGINISYLWQSVLYLILVSTSDNTLITSTENSISKQELSPLVIELEKLLIASFNDFRF